MELETAFKNAGGITEAERKKLTQEFEEAEQIKAETTAKVKMFVEGLMPFFIVREFTKRISDQMDYEEKGEIYYYVQQKLDREEIQKVLVGSVPDNQVDALMNMLLAKFKPKGFNEKTEPIHDLSKENTGRVNAMISSIDDFDVNGMVNSVKQKQTAAYRTMEINRILKKCDDR